MTTRPAQIGDVGVVLGLEGHGSIAVLALQTDKGEQAYLLGDRRIVADLVEAFGGLRVEVVEDEGSVYGAHGLRPV